MQEILSLCVATLDVNTTMKPFDDPEVVEALHYAVDRQQLVDAGQFGVGEVNTSGSRPATSATTRS